MDQQQSKKCPYCAEEIKEDVIVCRFCQKDLRDAGEIDSDYVPIRFERTSKTFKSDILTYWLFIIIGILVFLVGLGGKNDYVRILGASLLFTGIVWAIITRINIWWHRG